MMVICDWLDVTYAPDNCPYPELNLLLLGAGFSLTRSQDAHRCYVPPSGRGMLKVTHAHRFAKVSMSGGCCASLRASGLWDEALFILGSSPHRVTRLDAALDVSLDAADVLDKLRRKYPAGEVFLSRKAQRVTEFTSIRADGRRSGTYYVGHKDKARQSIRVYDKSLQMLDVYGESIATTTRYEVTARKDYGATLRDAAVPESIFWHIAAPAILKAPKGVPVWTPNLDQVWTHKASTFTAYEVMRNRVENSPELDALLDLADSVGPCGRTMLLSLLAKRADVTDDASQDQAAG
jgi:hypothetical protein